MKFEYKQVEFNLGLMRKQAKQDELNEMLNQHGREGWEVVNFVAVGESATYFVYLFKRQRSSDF